MLDKFKNNIYANYTHTHFKHMQLSQNIIILLIAIESSREIRLRSKYYVRGTFAYDCYFTIKYLYLI